MELSVATWVHSLHPHIAPCRLLFGLAHARVRGPLRGSCRGWCASVAATAVAVVDVHSAHAKARAAKAKATTAASPAKATGHASVVCPAITEPAELLLDGVGELVVVVPATAPIAAPSSVCAAIADVERIGLLAVADRIVCQYPALLGDLVRHLVFIVKARDECHLVQICLCKFGIKVGNGLVRLYLWLERWRELLL